MKTRKETAPWSLCCGGGIEKQDSCILSPVRVRMLILEPNDEQQPGSPGTAGLFAVVLGLFGMAAGMGGEDVVCFPFCLF